MNLVFKYYKWITPLHVAELSLIETKQALTFGSWYDLEGKFSVHDILYRIAVNISDYFGELDYWQIFDNKGNHMFDFIISEVDNGNLFYPNTDSIINGMCQGYFNPFDPSIDLDHSIDWKFFLQDAWRNCDYKEKKIIKREDTIEVNKFMENQYISLYKSLPLPFSKFKDLEFFLSNKDWPQEKDTDIKGVRSYCQENNISTELVLDWFKKHHADTDSSIEDFIYYTLGQFDYYSVK